MAMAPPASSSATSPSPSPSPSSLLPAQTLLTVSTNNPNPNTSANSNPSQIRRIQDRPIPQIHPQPLLYANPPAPLNRVFPAQTIRPQSSDKLGTRNPPILPYPSQPRAYGFLDHQMRPPSHQTLPRQPINAPNSCSPRTLPALLHPKANQVPTITSITEYKRDKNRDDSVVVINGRKVRLLNGASGSLYALCRSWVRNGWPQEIQPQFFDGVRVLPRPLPSSIEDTPVLEKNEGDDDDANASSKELFVGSVEDLSAHDLLKEHIKRAKKVRARLREERQRRIAPYRQRLYSVIERIQQAEMDPPVPSPAPSSDILGGLGHSLRAHMKQ